jgi:broad specificity phosphatase PhoE
MEQPTEVEFSNGESFTLMRSRVPKAVAALLDRHAGQSIALVTHGGVIRIALAEALSILPVNILRIARRYGAVNLVQFLGSHPIGELINAE